MLSPNACLMLPCRLGRFWRKRRSHPHGVDEPVVQAIPGCPCCSAWTPRRPVSPSQGTGKVSLRLKVYSACTGLPWSVTGL